MTPAPNRAVFEVALTGLAEFQQLCGEAQKALSAAATRGREGAEERDALRAERDELRLAIDAEMRKTIRAHAEVAVLTADNARLRAALLAVEWGPEPHGCLSECGWCLCDMGDGHAANCAVSAALAPRETP